MSGKWFFRLLNHIETLFNQKLKGTCLKKKQFVVAAKKYGGNDSYQFIVQPFYSLSAANACIRALGLQYGEYQIIEDTGEDDEL